MPPVVQALEDSYASSDDSLAVRVELEVEVLSGAVLDETQIRAAIAASVGGDVEIVGTRKSTLRRSSVWVSASAVGGHGWRSGEHA